MLLPLLFLFAVPGLTEAFFDILVDSNTQVDTSDCPITYYGQEYTTVYTNFTGEHLFVCFNGYYTPEGNGDCIRMPNTDNKTNLNLYNNNDPSYWTYLTDFVHSSVNTVTNNVTCYLHFYNTSSQGVALLGMGSQSVVYWYWINTSQTFINVLVNGDVVENVLGVQNNVVLSDTSGCRISGLGVKPGTTRQIPDTCTFLTCSSTRIPSMKTCGPPGQCNGNGTSLDPSTLECVDVSDGQTPPPANTTITPTQNVTVTKQTTPEPSTPSPTDESTVSTQSIPVGNNFVVALSIGFSTNLPLEDIKDEFLSQLKDEFVRRGLPPDLGLRILKSQRV